jgi:protein SCO1
MKTSRTGKIRGAFAAAIALVAGLTATGATPAQAQRVPPGTVGQTRVLSINAARDVSFNQKLDTQLPLDATFRDERGAQAPLSAYFGKKPVILVLPFYKCPGVCTNELNGMVDLFKEMEKKFRPGRDFNVVTVSINPKEGPELAAAKKREYMDILNQPGAETGWHFLTGEETNIRRVADSVGFKYAYDEKTDQYAHAAGIVILTPGGKVSRYFFGVGYPKRDVQLALIEAGQGKVGSLTDQLLLPCYDYDPQHNRYGLAVFRIMQVACTITVLALGTFMFFALRADKKNPKLVKTPDGRVVSAEEYARLKDAREELDGQR